LLDEDLPELFASIASKSKTTTLLFAAKDKLRNNATVLQEFLSGGAPG
jgi:uncharacterized protein YeaO (DUF488 family)